MGAAFSGGSLCRMVGGVEIVVSSVIIGFGSQALALFYAMDEGFQSEFDRIQYSAITAIVQGSLTILASLMILFASRQKPGQPYLDVNDDDASENGDIIDQAGDSLRKSSVKSATSSLPRNTSYISSVYQIKKKLALIYRLWLAFSVISIGLLLVVFVCSQDYCIQNDADRKRWEDITDNGKNPFNLVDGRKIMIPPCYAESMQTIDLRDSLTNLYSYCLVNIFTIAVFMFVVYYQLKRVTRMGNRTIKEDKVKVLPSSKGKEDVEEGGDAQNGP